MRRRLILEILGDVVGVEKDAHPNPMIVGMRSKCLTVIIANS